MARCERCGKDGCAEGSILCNACRSDLTYHYVTKIEKKRARRSLKARLKAWWWPIHPEERRRHQRQAALAAALVALLLLALIFVRVGTGGGSANRQNAGEAGDSYADR